MNLHEFQAKSLFREYEIPVPEHHLARTTTDVLTAAKQLGGSAWVLKAQVHAGGRGKAGGVQLVRDAAQLSSTAQTLLGTRLVTHQTGPEGLPVNTLLVEPALDIQRELYLGMTLDRSAGHYVIMASAAGGMDIEAVAADTPELLHRYALPQGSRVQPWQARAVCKALGLEMALAKSMLTTLRGLQALQLEQDASLVEINPLILTADQQLLALDAKLNIDDNALYRQPRSAEALDESQIDPTELAATAQGLSYVTLDGDIGCMVNGAGLAMATMDLVKLHGGEPANFLDVGGGTTAERVAEAFKLILATSKVKAVLVNIFGGIVRCDLIAEGIVQALQQIQVDVPVIVRLQGTNVDQGRAILADSPLAIISADDLEEAAKAAVVAAKGVAQ